MTNKKSTKHALLLSVLSLLLCISMLVGSTFAWFTDSVTSAQNTIQSGNLDVALYYTYDAAVAADATSSAWIPVDTNTDVFGYNNWEPGYTKVAYFMVANEGSLALKYQLTADVYEEKAGKNQDGETFLLSDYIKTALVNVGATRDEILALEGTPLKDSFAMSKRALASDGTAIVGLAIWMPTSVDNVANHDGDTVPEITFGIHLMATQESADTEFDSFGKDYDLNADYNYTSSAAKRPATATQPLTLKSIADAPVAVELSADALNNMPAEVESIQLAHTKAIVDASAKTIQITAADLVDQDGKKIDLENNTIPFTVTLDVPFADGEMFDIYHDNELVASTVVADGKITYTALHFCEINIAPFDTKKGTPVTTADQLIAALANGEDVFFMNDITMKADLSNGYGATGIAVNGQTVNGNGCTLTVTGAGSTWDSAIFIKAGTIQNITVAGAMRGIFASDSAVGDIYLDGVTFSNVVYTFNSDGTSNTREGGVFITNCNMNGWTSFSDTHTAVVFTNCTFAKGSGYQFARPYNETQFVNCCFAENFAMDPRVAVTFENCTLAGEALTADNLATLVTNNIANAVVK